MKGLEPLVQHLWLAWLHNACLFFCTPLWCLLFSFLSLIASGMYICLCFSVSFSLALSVLCPAHLSRHRANEPSWVWTSANHLSKLTTVLQEEVCSAIIQIIQTISQNHLALFPTFHHIPHPLDHFILLSLAVDHWFFFLPLWWSFYSASFLSVNLIWDIWNCWWTLKTPFTRISNHHG